MTIDELNVALAKALGVETVERHVVAVTLRIRANKPPYLVVQRLVYGAPGEGIARSVERLALTATKVTP